MLMVVDVALTRPAPVVTWQATACDPSPVMVSATVAGPAAGNVADSGEPSTVQ